MKNVSVYAQIWLEKAQHEGASAQANDNHTDRQIYLLIADLIEDKLRWNCTEARMWGEKYTRERMLSVTASHEPDVARRDKMLRTAQTYETFIR